MNRFFIIFIAAVVFNQNVAKEKYFRPFYPYYSQCGQDKFANERFFKNKKNGTFVDIGAHDGVSYSNTYFFEKKLDWTGICVEPNPERFRDLVNTRGKRSICLPVAVADFKGRSKFLKVSGYPEMLSGLLDYYDPRHLNRVNQEIIREGGSKATIDIEVLRLKDIFKEYQIEHVDFMSIDTEGSELEVIKSIDFSAIKIDVITVENNFGDNSIQKYLATKGYKLASKVEFDDFYVHEDFVGKY